MGSDPLVIHTEPLSPRAIEWLSERAELIAAKPGEQAFEERASAIEGLLVRTYTIVDDALLDRMPALRVVGRAGVGIDNIDVAACRAREVEVVYTPDANTEAVAEYVFALVLDAIRPRVCLEHAADEDTWSSMRRSYVGERQLDEMTIGILGLGRIGSRVAQIGAAFGSEVLYSDLLDFPLERRFGAECVSVEELFDRSDILSIHIDGRPENHRHVGANLLNHLRADAILINTSRGVVLDVDATTAFLRGNPRALGILDVHDPEPVPADCPLFSLPNARLAPHLASRTESAMERMSAVVEDLWGVLEGEAPIWPAPKT